MTGQQQVYADFTTQTGRKGIFLNHEVIFNIQLSF